MGGGDTKISQNTKFAPFEWKKVSSSLCLFALSRWLWTVDLLKKLPLALRNWIKKCVTEVNYFNRYFFLSYPCVCNELLCEFGGSSDSPCRRELCFLLSSSTSGICAIQLLTVQWQGSCPINVPFFECFETQWKHSHGACLYLLFLCLLQLVWAGFPPSNQMSKCPVPMQWKTR